MTNPHIVVVPAPKQGHVVPLMELSLCLVKHGFRVTFVNTLFNHEVIVSACKRDNVGNQLHLVSVQYGLGSDDHGRNDNSGKSTAESLRALPKRLEELIEEIKGGGGGDEIACVVVDWGIGWILDVAAKMGIPRAAFYPASATTFALSLRIPKLISDGILNNDGTPTKEQMFQLLPTVPPISTKNFPWTRVGDLAMQKFVFEIIEKGNKAVKEADWLFCNSAYEFEPEAFSLAPQMIPIGPLLASNRLGNSLGSLWPEDLTCLKWLGQQSPCSVIYVAFGSSTTNFNHNQFQELALGLELSNMPFLWVVRLNSTDGINDAYPEGFLDRVATRGKIVDWVPQQKVLSHPSVACFLSHCGWNSTMEGVGLGFDPDETEIVRREEIKNKVEQLLGDKNLKERASSLKEVASNSVREGGSSYSNFQRFTERLKADKGFFNTLFDCLCVPFTMRL